MGQIEKFQKEPMHCKKLFSSAKLIHWRKNPQITVLNARGSNLIENKPEMFYKPPICTQTLVKNGTGLQPLFEQ